MIVTNQMGITVFFLEPNPNFLKLPSISYINLGWKDWTIKKSTININIEMAVILRRTNNLFIFV